MRHLVFMMDLDQTTELSNVVRWRNSWPILVLPIRLASHRWKGVNVDSYNRSKCRFLQLPYLNSFPTSAEANAMVPPIFILLSIRDNFITEPNCRITVVKLCECSKMTKCARKFHTNLILQSFCIPDSKSEFHLLYGCPNNQ
jgi:hypothetical protein